MLLEYRERRRPADLTYLPKYPTDIEKGNYPFTVFLAILTCSQIKEFKLKVHSTKYLPTTPNFV